MATPRARSLATWLGLMPLAALVAVTAWQPWLGFGLIIGVVGGALTLVALMRTLEWLDDRDRLPAAPLAVGAVVVSVAIVAVPAVLALLLLGRSSAIAAGGVSAVLVAGFFGRIELARQLDRRRMRQLDRALVAGGDLTAALAPLPPHYLFAVVTRLADHGRWAELLARQARPPVLGAGPGRGRRRRLLRSRAMLLTRAESSHYRETSLHADVMAFLAALAGRGDRRLHVTGFGYSPGGRELPLVVVSTRGVRTPAEARAPGCRWC
jgi:hypothetical protein